MCGEHGLDIQLKPKIFTSSEHVEFRKIQKKNQFLCICKLIILKINYIKNENFLESIYPVEYKINFV